MRRHQLITWTKRLLSLGVVTVGLGCSPRDILSVPPPANVSTSSQITSQTAAEQLFNQSRWALFSELDGPYGYLSSVSLMSDEFTYAAGADILDARESVPVPPFTYEEGDGVLENMMGDRQTLLLTITPLEKYETGAGVSKIGETFALIGYIELLLSEDYCAGLPLSHINFGGGLVYGTPLTMDSLLGSAAANFDSALNHTGGNDTIQYLADVGLGRANLDRGNFSAAITAVSQVPTNFVYAFTFPTTFASPAYTMTFYGFPLLASGYYGNYLTNFFVSDREGGNGLDFRSAHDPRLVLDSSLTDTYETIDHTQYNLPDSLYYAPLKFGVPSNGVIPLASGVEAALIQAEASLPANGATGAGNWLTTLNTLRNTGCTISGSPPDTVCALGAGMVPGQSAGLPDLVDPGTDSLRIALMFRERAFWLFGTGTRLGDMRRLLRQHHWDQSGVYPVGPYKTGWQSSTNQILAQYGTDVDITLPVAANNSVSPTLNPNYKGCLTSTKDP